MKSKLALLGCNSFFRIGHGFNRLEQIKTDFYLFQSVKSVQSVSYLHVITFAMQKNEMHPSTHKKSNLKII